MARKGKSGLFTYDFGVAIAQGTVLRIGKMTTAVTALAGAMYFLNKSATAYVKTLRENTAQFGGIVNAMQKMQQSQDRIVKGQTAFSVDDQMKGMNQLMAAGLDVEKNFEFINKAAHAMGQSFTGFSSAISAGIYGDMSAMVQMGLITQRASKRFDIYQAGTIQRQQAIMEFMKSHSGVQKMIAEDFQTVNDKITHLGGVFKQFILNIIGNPKDPNSLYAKAVEGIGYMADAFQRNMGMIQQWGERIGEVLGWVINNIGKFVVYLGRQFKRFFGFAEQAGKTFSEGTKSIIVWLEFWKLRLKRVFDTVFDWMVEHKGFLKNLAIAFGLIFSVTTVAKFVGAIIGAITMMNPFVVALTAVVVGLLYALDKLSSISGSYKKKKEDATKGEMGGIAKAKSAKEIESYITLHPKDGDKGGLNVPSAATLALQLSRHRRGMSVAVTEKQKKDFYSVMGGATIENVSKVLFAELSMYKKTGKKLGYYLTETPRGPSPRWLVVKDDEEFPDFVTPIFGGEDGGTVKVKKWLDNAEKTFENFSAPAEDILESLGLTKDKQKELLKETKKGFSSVVDSLNKNILGATYIQKGAMPVTVATDNGENVVKQMGEVLAAEKRKNDRLNPVLNQYRALGLGLNLG